MEKIKKFFSTCCYEEFACRFIGMVILSMLSVSLQYLIFLSEISQVIPHNFGCLLDMVLFAIWLAIAVPLSCSDLIVYEGIQEKGKPYVAAMWFAVVGVYTCVLIAVNCWILTLCLALVLFTVFRLEKLGADTTISDFTIGVSLFICLGFDIAMFLADIRPISDIYGIIVLSVTTLIVWYKSAFE